LLNIRELAQQARSYAKSYTDTKNVLRDFASTLEFEQKMRGGRKVLVLNKGDVPGLLFVGDVHGDLRTVSMLLERANAPTLLDQGYRIVFLGDYIDRGYEQLEALLFIALLKQRLGSSVITLRGNHEPLSWLPVYPHDFPHVLRARFGAEQAQEIYSMCRDLFEHLLFLLYIPERVLAVHGGPPITRVLKMDSADEILRVEDDPEALEDILWSDPVDELTEPPWTFSFRGAGKLWGPPITKEVLKKLRVRIIVRGHEPCPLGYKLNHEGRVVTVFSMKGYYGNVSAAVMVTDIDGIDRDVEKKMVLA